MQRLLAFAWRPSLQIGRAVIAALHGVSCLVAGTRHPQIGKQVNVKSELLPALADTHQMGSPFITGA